MPPSRSRRQTLTASPARPERTVSFCPLASSRRKEARSIARPFSSTETARSSIDIERFGTGPIGSDFPVGDAKRSQLIPTAAERLVWGRGSGDGLVVADTEIGKVGGRTYFTESTIPLLDQNFCVWRHVSGALHSFDVCQGSLYPPRTSKADSEIITQ